MHGYPKFLTSSLAMERPFPVQSLILFVHSSVVLENYSLVLCYVSWHNTVQFQWGTFHLQYNSQLIVGNVDAD